MDIKKGMDSDEWRDAWFAAARARGHKLRESCGYVDAFVTNRYFCNGPGCEVCGWTECMHCDRWATNIPECKGK